MRTAPAKKQPPASDARVRRNSARRLCDCACQQRRELLCVLRLPSKASRSPSGAHARHSCPRTLCLLAPTQRCSSCGCFVNCACHTKGNRGPSGAHARRSFFRTVCALRLPRERQRDAHARRSSPREFVFFVLSRSSSGCGAPATPKAALSPVSHTGPHLPQEALCTALFTRKEAGK